ncbi:recombinase family protein [Pseudovibrio sp. Alg231-02]|uniref:recombinase family protein n=1 Tax=Pseudovibrio sp. Alg231-02 TaxID=1922223 RepID=UPI00131F29AF|nr:recombinase family protein [Pseudovibrio sp. Alg231-02]
MIRGYIRTDKNEHTRDDQMEELRAANCETFRVDDGISRRAFRKPGLDRLMQEAVAGDVLVFCSLDRIAEYQRDIAEFFAKCQVLGVDVVVLREGLNTLENPIVFQVMAAFVGFARGLDDERRALAIEKAKRKQGRPSKLNEEQQHEAVEMKASGKTISQIAATFSVSRATIYSLLEPKTTTLDAFANIPRDELREIMFGKREQN